MVTIKLGDLGYTYPGLSGKTKDDFGFGKPFIPYMNIFSNSKINKNILENVDIKPSDRQNKVQIGDLFFTTSSETVEEVGMTSVLLENLGEAYLNSFCFGFRLHNFDILLPEFAAYLFRSNEVRKKISLFGQGSTRYNLPKTQLFSKLYLNLPDKVQQKNIAKILTCFDSVIEQTQSAIAKYKAIKQGMLHDLFTRGLDANGKIRPRYEETPELYKESKLGMIPKEWEVKRLGNYLINLEAGVSVNSLDVSSSNHIAVLKTSAVSQGYFFPDENKIVVSKDLERVKTSPKADSIIISRMNTPLLVGECGYIEKDYPLLFLPDRLWQTVFRDKESICVLWLNYLLNTERYRKFVKDTATGTSDSMKNITKSSFFELEIPICMIFEQNEIAKRLLSLDNKLRTEEMLLQKYQSIKRGLMGDLLNGKKKVEVKNQII